RVIISRHVRFDEGYFPYPNLHRNTQLDSSSSSHSAGLFCKPSPTPFGLLIHLKLYLRLTSFGYPQIKLYLQDYQLSVYLTPSKSASLSSFPNSSQSPSNKDDHSSISPFLDTSKTPPNKDSQSFDNSKSSPNKDSHSSDNITSSPLSVSQSFSDNSSPSHPHILYTN
ncbi:unnamed protein product, partial [Ilex paraguariensis]